MADWEMRVIATIHTPFPSKFGIPRQSGLVKETRAEIVFEKEYRVMEAVRGLEGFSHLWLLWDFHASHISKWEPTVRPPRLGGNQRVGVFATRSPFRPNPIGLSVVELIGIRKDPARGPVLEVGGADLLDGTPIWDIKPYLPRVDSIPEARDGFAGAVAGHALAVEIPEDMEALIPMEERAALRAILRQDPRPGYQRDPSRIYGFPYHRWEVRFSVEDEILRVLAIKERDEHE